MIVVDDDASMRRALRTQLQVLGFNVLVCQSAEELLASEFPADDACLLLDVWMPGMNGIELCRSLAAAGRRWPTILMSGLEDETDHANHARSRADRPLVQAVRRKTVDTCCPEGVE